MRLAVLGLAVLFAALPADAQRTNRQAEKDEAFRNELSSIVKSAQESPAKESVAQESKAPLPPLTGEYSDQQVMEMLSSQLVARGCWLDQDDMPDARRLRAVLAVRFGPDGRFLDAPKLVEPATAPENDRPMQVFIARAQAALEKCNQAGFRLPQSFLEKQPPVVIELDFRP
jgi:hypothetical protein